MSEHSINYDKFAQDYIAAMKEENLEQLQELPEILKTNEECKKGYEALAELFDKQSDEFKEKYQPLLDNIKTIVDANLKVEEASKVEETSATESTDTASDEATDPVEVVASEAVEPEPSTSEETSPSE